MEGKYLTMSDTGTKILISPFGDFHFLGPSFNLICTIGKNEAKDVAKFLLENSKDERTR